MCAALDSTGDPRGRREPKPRRKFAKFRPTVGSVLLGASRRSIDHAARYAVVVLARAQEGVAMLVDTGFAALGLTEFTKMDEHDAPKPRAVQCSCAT